MEMKVKLYTTETIAQAKRVQAYVDELRGSVDDVQAEVGRVYDASGREMTRTEIVAACLYRLYAALGTTPIAVANCLGAMGVRGVLFGERCCPLANLGRMATGVWVHVMDGAYSLQDSTAGDVWHDLPAAAAAMMRGFDTGDYPWLEREPQGDEGAVQLSSQGVDDDPR